MSDEQTKIPEQRKASDILLSIESKVNALTGAMSVYDLNVKIILDRVNSIYRYIEQLKAEANEDQQESEVIQTSSDYVMETSHAPIPDRRIGRLVEAPQAPPPEQTQYTPIQVPQSQTKKVNVPSTDKKVPVIQQIKYSTGQDMFMADVSIADENKEQVWKGKTNAIGKWQAHLKPGRYYINTVKTDTTTKKQISALQEITIPNSDSIVNLPPAIIKR